MNLYGQSLHSLRDLAARLGIRSPTVYTKTELILKIEERKKQIEENNPEPKYNNLGRPRTTDNYIGIRRSTNGKLDFFVAKKHLLYDDISEEIEQAPSKEQMEKQIQQLVQERVNEILEENRPPVIEDEETRQFLEKAKAFLQKLLGAIEKALDIKYKI